MEISRFARLTIPFAGDEYLDEPRSRQVSGGQAAFNDPRNQFHFKIHACGISKTALGDNHHGSLRVQRRDCVRRHSDAFEISSSQYYIARNIMSPG